MSMTHCDEFNPSSRLQELRRQSWGRLFGGAIRKVRESREISVEQAAVLAGMELSDWEAIEAGRVPTENAVLRSMAAALEIRFDQIAILVYLCHEAWEG